MGLSKAAVRVIELARKVHDYYAAELPKWHPNYPLVKEEENAPPPPPEEKQLRDFLATLSEDLIYQLIVIMYLGRGDFAAEELAGYYQALKGTLGDSAQAASQLMDKAPLADHLTDGLEELRKHGISVDKMPLNKAKVRKT